MHAYLLANPENDVLYGPGAIPLLLISSLPHLLCLLVYFTFLLFPFLLTSSIFLLFHPFPVYQKEATKPGFSFLGSFHVVVYFVMNECLLGCVRFSFSVLSQAIGCEERLRNDLFCVRWDVKPEINQ